MIIGVTGWFPIYKNGYETGEKEFTVSHGYDEVTGGDIILPCEHPLKLGACFNSTIGEWVLYDKEDLE